MSKIKLPGLYVETSVFNYYFLDDPYRKQDQIDTKKLFMEIKSGTVLGYFSTVVLAELNECAEPKRSKMLKLIAEYGLNEISIYQGYKDLAERYIAEGIVPRKKAGDALHLALATVNNLESVVSWNCRHIVCFKTRHLVRAVNLLYGYGEIDVNTPREVITND